MGDTGGGPDGGGDSGGGRKSPEAPNPNNKSGQCSSATVSMANQVYNNSGTTSYTFAVAAAALWAASAATATFGQAKLAVPLGLAAEDLSNLSLGAQVVQVMAGGVNAQQTGDSSQFISSSAGLAAGIAAGTVNNSGALPGATGAALQQGMSGNNSQPSCH